MDPDGGTLTYAWVQTKGTPVALLDAASPTLYIDVPNPARGSEELGFSLTVTNSKGLSATSPVNVSVAMTLPEPPKSTISLIDEAVRTEAITAEKGLTYKVFALHGDSRLPDQFRGASVERFNGTEIMAEVSENYKTMSEEAKTNVYPFLLPAYMDGSWYPRVLKRVPDTAHGCP